ncbi:HipA domain-containing protein [Sedimentibacter sp.]|uniref:HipA domain-containing protein n=1 Tax=Sedimentibacter sp. TaxID=1960295 RepID=UPI0028ABCD79|nr:HipA domain-containing protein [Sedimentibacter sp.]
MHIDFTKCDQNKFKMFGGANGSKIGIIYNGESYMLKFPPEAKINKVLSYSNSTISEYIGCKIYNAIGISAQETILGTFIYKGKNKIVVACKDLETDGYILKDFASLKNTIIDSAGSGYGTELSDILQAIDEQDFISPIELKKFFWDMFVIDAFLGNFDRHNGNWGFLINPTKGDVKISPVFDCGSCLFAESDIEIKRQIMKKKAELEYRLYVIPKSSITHKDKKIIYFDFLKSGQNKDCTKSLMDITNRIDLNKVNEIIDGIDLISEEEKEFYKFLLKARKEEILDKAILEIRI